MNSVELSLVMPVKDEEAAIGPCLARLIPVLEAMDDDAARSFEILFIDDGSSDATLEAIRKAHAADPRIRCISLSRNFGKEAALSAGLDAARGKAVVPLDVDLQDPPEALPRMVAKWRDGFDVVLAVRADRSGDSLMKRATAKWFYRLLGWLSECPIPADVGDFRLLDRRVVEALRLLPERTRFMKGLFAWLGFRQAEVEYARAARAAGESKWRYWRLWNLALEGLFSFSTLPLRIWTYVGLLVAVLALAFAAFIVGRTLISGVDVPGYASIVALLSFFSGVNMIGLGILGEYLGRVFTEVKRRPNYLVRRSARLWRGRRRRPTLGRARHRSVSGRVSGAAARGDRTGPSRRGAPVHPVRRRRRGRDGGPRHPVRRPDRAAAHLGAPCQSARLRGGTAAVVHRPLPLDVPPAGGSLAGAPPIQHRRRPRARTEFGDRLRYRRPARLALRLRGPADGHGDPGHALSAEPALGLRNRTTA
jgi:glycosyltransferase involved in cell wall biosynthesis